VTSVAARVLIRAARFVVGAHSSRVQQSLRLIRAVSMFGEGDK